MARRIETYQDFEGGIFSPNRRRMALTSRGKLAVLDCTPECAPFKEIATLHLNDHWDAIQFSSDGQFVSWLADGRSVVYLLDIENEEQPVCFRNYAGRRGVVFSPGGDLVVFQKRESHDDAPLLVLEVGTWEEKT